jgi:hypothetical protein
VAYQNPRESRRLLPPVFGVVEGLDSSTSAFPVFSLATLVPIMPVCRPHRKFTKKPLAWPTYFVYRVWKPDPSV